MHQRLFSFLYLLQMQEAFFQNSSPLPVDTLFSITVVVMWWLYALPTADMYGLLLRKKKKHEKKLLTLSSKALCKVQVIYEAWGSVFHYQMIHWEKVFFIFEVFHLVMKHCVECLILCLLIYYYMRLDWLRAVAFQLNLKYLHAKVTNLSWVVV